MKIIDPHLHLFDLEQGDYHWLSSDNAPYWSDKAVINKSFTEQDLILSSPLSLAGFVHIEAGFDNKAPWRELSYLEQNCQKPFAAIAAINLNLDSKEFIQQVKKLLLCPTFIGVRHILDLQASELLSNARVLNNISWLNNLVLEQKLNINAFIFEIQMPLTDNLSVDILSAVIAANSNITFIINHAGLPPTAIGSNEWLNWQNNLTKLASYAHLAIKCSGWEMITRQYYDKSEWLNLTLQVCFDAFGQQRMMLASNFPLCLFSYDSYQDYWQQLLNTDFFTNKSSQEKNALCYHNALSYYEIKI